MTEDDVLDALGLSRFEVTEDSKKITITIKARDHADAADGYMRKMYLSPDTIFGADATLIVKNIKTGHRKRLEMRMYVNIDIHTRSESDYDDNGHTGVL